jgi:hypothetical protein
MNRGRDTTRRTSQPRSTLTPRARNVLRAFNEARRAAPGFLLSSGVLPELSELVTERLYRIVQGLAGERFARERHVLALRAALREVARSADAFDRVESEVAALTAAETTAAYLFGLAVGLSIGTLPDPLQM